MKKIFFLMLLSFSVYSQNKMNKEYSINVSSNLQVALGNNYLNESYTNARGFGFSFQNNLSKNIFIGVFYNYYGTEITQKDKIGNFDSSNSVYLGAFIGYHHDIHLEKFYLEHAISYGYKVINNKSAIGSYAIHGQPIAIGTKINYKLSNQFDVFLKNDLIYFNNKVEISGEYRNFYKKAFIFEPSLGIRFNFKQKKQN
jgi:hypothetical protein